MVSSAAPLMSRLAVTLLLLIALPWSAHAQTGSVRGTVVDGESDRPVGNVVVDALGSGQVTVTDEGGRFLLPELPAGVWTLDVSWFGYRDRRMEVTVVAGATEVVELVLQPDPLLLGELEVTAVSRQPERVVESPAAVQVVEPGRVRDLAASGDVARLLTDLPGVQVQEGGAETFQVNPRAFNALVNRRLLVLVDGRDVSAPFAGGPEWPTLSVSEDRTRVELVRGPGSALYGANAFSGILNIVTPSVRQAQGTRITAGYGERSSLHLNGRHAFVTDDLRWGLRVSGRYSRSGSSDRSRTALGDLAEEYRPAVEGPVPGSAPPPGYEFLPLQGQRTASPPGIPAEAQGEADPVVTVGGSARVERYRDDGGAFTLEGGFTRVENQVNASSGSRAQILRSDQPWARAALGTERVNVFATFGGRTGEQVDLAGGRTFRDRSHRTHLEAQVIESFADDRLRAVLGGSIRRETVDTEGTVLAPEFDARADAYYAIFGQATWALAPSVDVVVAGRWDASSLYDSELSPRAALVWAPTQDQNLRVTYGRAFLMPTVSQRFVRVPLGPPQDLSALETALRTSPLGPGLAGIPPGALLTRSEAVPVLTIGDQNLGPEEVTAWEVGYKGQFRRVYVTLDGHLSRFENFFTDLLPGVHPDFGPWTAPEGLPASVASAVEATVNESVPGLTRLRDGSTAILFAGTGAGRADQWGVDVAAAVQLSDEVELTGNYGFVKVDFEEGTFLGGDSLPSNTPTHTANLAATYQRPQGLRVRLGLRLVEGFPFRSGVWEGRVPGRQSVDLSLRRPLTRRLEAALSATNLLDQERYHYFGGSLVGRRITFSLTWEP